jgi:luciferase family oxidoreductase group 1
MPAHTARPKCPAGSHETRMTDPGLRLSVLDQSPLYAGETAADALQHTIELATRAEEWGYHRFWVTEHHGSNRVMGSSPEVLVSHLLAKTSRIRLGSGGVMLQHYSPYKVAENFNVLASLAPGRVDLGIGGGPGGLPRSTQALKIAPDASGRTLAEKLTELDQFLHDQLAADHPLHGLQASPLPPQPADLFVLGTTSSSAVLAADMALPYVFALFLNSDEAMMRLAVDTYRDRFDYSKGGQPQVMLALPVIVADTDDEAGQRASEITVVRLTLASGKTFTTGTLEAANEFGKQSGEEFDIQVRQAAVVHGSPDTARRKLYDIQHDFDIEEVIVVTAIRDFPKRLHSYRILSEAFSQVAASQ